MLFMMPEYHIKKLPECLPLKEKFRVGAISSYQLSGTLTPSGRITVGRVPQKKKSRLDDEYESTRALCEYHLRQHWHYQQGLVSEIRQRTIRDEQLGLSSVSNCHKTSSTRRHGLKGISPTGRKKVREACYLLESKYKRRLGFYTLTCSYVDPQSIYLYNKNISYIQKTFFQEMKREYERQACQWSYCSVLEIQARRFDRSGIPVLHIHYVAPCYRPSSYTWILTSDKIRSIWQRVLQNCLGATTDVKASVDSTVVRTSAVGYISKYMSKGGETFSYVAQICPDQLPSQWWSTSRNVRAAVVANTVILPHAVCEALMSGHYGSVVDVNDIIYLRYLIVLWNQQYICVGMSADIAYKSASGLRPWSELQMVHGYL